MIVYPPHECDFRAEENIIVGNVCLYGAVSVRLHSSCPAKQLGASAQRHQSWWGALSTVSLLTWLTSVAQGEAYFLSTASSINTTARPLKNKILHKPEAPTRNCL